MSDPKTIPIQPIELGWDRLIDELIGEVRVTVGICGSANPDFTRTNLVSKNLRAAIRRALDEQVEACARLHENVDPGCDHEPKGVGAGAMRAVIQYRDLIRALKGGGAMEKPR